MIERATSNPATTEAFGANYRITDVLQPIDESLPKERVALIEKLPLGTEVIVELPPILSAQNHSYSNDSRIETPFLILENKTHLQAKTLNQQERTHKDGTGDFCCLISMRLPGLFTLTINNTFDGLSPASMRLWQERLARWGHSKIAINDQIIDLQNPDVAFSQIIRHFFNSTAFKNWLSILESKLVSAVHTDLEKHQTSQQWIKHPLEISLADCNKTINEALLLLLQEMGEFRSNHLHQLPLNQIENAWYINAIFGFTTNLIIEPLIETAMDGDQPTIQKIPVLSSNLRSKADIMAYSGGINTLMSDFNTANQIQDTMWMGDSNAQIDQLIYQLRLVSSVVDQVIGILQKIGGVKNKSYVDQIIAIISRLGKTEAEIEHELLRKPWQAYAVIPLYEKMYEHMVQATTHLSTNANYILESRPLIAIGASDGATTVTRDPNQREDDTVFSTATPQILFTLTQKIMQLTAQKLSAWLNETNHTADDRVVQAQVIHAKSNISKLEFQKWESDKQKHLPNFQHRKPVHITTH